MNVENSVKGAKFVNAKPVHFPAKERRWANDFGRGAAYATAASHDIDGSVSGTPDSRSDQSAVTASSSSSPGKTARASVSLTRTAMDKGSWVIFELPGFRTAAAGAEQSSLAALRDADETSYYKGVPAASLGI